ncbi:MAG: hypothetical protein WCK90_03030 [archaeon]
MTFEYDPLWRNISPRDSLPALVVCGAIIAGMCIYESNSPKNASQTHMRPREIYSQTETNELISSRMLNVDGTNYIFTIDKEGMPQIQRYKLEQKVILKLSKVD